MKVKADPKVSDRKYTLHEVLDDLEALFARQMVKARNIADIRSQHDPDRDWLTQFAVGQGLDVCCGHFPIANAMGMDTSFTTGVITGFMGSASKINLPNERVNFIITNYVDQLRDILEVFDEWHRILVPGGILAFTCADGHGEEFIIRPKGTLQNNHRVNVFTDITVRYFLERCKFENVQVSRYESSLRVKCNK